MACCLSFLLWLALLQTSLAVNVAGPNGTVVTQILLAPSSNPEVKVVEDRDLGKILVYPPQPKEFTVKIIARIMYPDDQYLEKISTVMVGGAGVTIESSEIRNSLILATLKVAPGASGGRFSITYENKDNPNHKGCNVRLLPVEIEEVKFAGAKYHELKSDNLNTTYSAPHWVDKDSNGNPTDTANGEKDYSVAYTRNTKPSIGAKFSIQGLPNNLAIKLRAKGSDGIEIPETAAQVNRNDVTLAVTASSTNWPNTIKFYDRSDANKAFKLDWKIKVGDAGWTQVVSTKHQVYLTLNDPVTALRQETLFYLSAKNADGKNAPGQAVASIWNDFTDPIGNGVVRIDGVQMRYWNPRRNSCQNLVGMLADPIGNGTCVAWSDLLHQTVRSQGIAGSSIVEVESGFRNDANLSLDGGLTDRGLFLVKDWNFANAGTAPAGCAPFTHKPGEANNLQGVEGQGNPEPPEAFFNHFITLYDGKYYDPSYGNGPFPDQKTWENASLDGYQKGCAPGAGIPHEVVLKKDDPNVIESVFK